MSTVNIPVYLGFCEKFEEQEIKTLHCLSEKGKDIGICFLFLFWVY